MAKEAVNDFKFGVSDLADMLDTDATYTRVKLRNAGIKKLANGGKAYGWKTKDELKALAEKLKAAPAPKASTKKEDPKSAKKDDKKAAASVKKDTKADTKKAPVKAEAKTGKTADAKSKDKAAAGKDAKKAKAA